MFYPVEMQKIRIIGVKSIAPDLISKLHELGVVEITSSEIEGVESGRPLENYSVVSAHLVFIRAIRSVLNPKIKTDIKFSVDINQLNSNFDALGNFVSKYNKFKELDFSKMKNDLLKYFNLLSELAKLSESDSQLRKDLKILSILRGFKVDFSKLETKHTSYFVGEISQSNLALTKNNLDKQKKPYNLMYSSGVALLVCSNEFEDISDSLIEFKPIEIPKGINYPNESITRLSSELESKEATIIKIKEELNTISSKYNSVLSGLEKELTIEADEAEIASKFGFTGSSFIVEGWIKAEDAKGLQSNLKQFERKMYLEYVKPTHHDSPPVVLSNPGIQSPIEFLTKNYSLPNAQELDPTFFLFITVPLLYGMIVGDVFYGLISILLSLFLIKKFESSYIMSNVSRIWLYGAIPTIFFGILYDEWMGMGHQAFLNILAGWGLFPALVEPLYYPWIHRLHDLGLLLGITALVGLVHLAVGFIFGFINEWGHNKKHAFAKIAWIGIEIGGAIFVTSSLLNALPIEYGTPGLVLLIISTIALFLTEGVVGILEIPGLAGNIFSYMRIAVIGVVGVIIAEVINGIFSPVAANGILVIILLPLFVILHTVNAFIAMFEALIQGGRLNLVEFKMKFLKGGGKLFKPFSVSEK